MMKDNPTMRLKGTIGEAAADGLLAGEAAGVIMAAYLALAGLTWGSGPVEVLALFDPGETASALFGLIAHLAVSGVYGTVFGLGWRLAARWLSRIPVWLAGTVCGLILFAPALAILLPAASSPLLTIPPAHFALAHGLYGLTLGIGLARRYTPDR